MQESKKRTLLDCLQKLRSNGGRLLHPDIYNSPGRFVEEFLPTVQVYGYQSQLLDSVEKNLRNAIYAPRGVGKTAPAAWILLWFALTRERAGVQWKVLTIASSWLQLTRYFWAEVHKWSRLLDWDKIGREWNNYQLQKTALVLEVGSAFAASCDDPDKIEGLHAEETLIIGDEMKGQQDRIMDGLEGVGMKGDTRYFYISTPGAPAGKFYDICTGKYPDWNVMKVNTEDAVGCGAISQEYIDRRKQQWGEDSPMYRQHILGEFAGVESGSLYDLEWVTAAMEKFAGDTPRHIGIDVAEYGSDESVMAVLGDYGIMELKVCNTIDLMELSGHISRALTEYGIPAAVDSIGVGAGVYARLKELEHDVFRYVASAKARSELYLNTRAESYWILRERLQEGSVALPDDRMLREELLAITWTMTSNGKIAIDKKDKIKKTLGRSPDRADAVAIAMYSFQAGVSPKDIIYA